MCDEETGPSLGPLGASVRRTPLARGAWVDLRRGWLAGSGAVFGALVTGRGRHEDTMVAIVSLGAPRALLLRPRRVKGDGEAGGAPLRFEVGHGDLLVMGGSCQRTWEHAVPKTSQPVGPRISVQFRPRGVR